MSHFTSPPPLDNIYRDSSSPLSQSFSDPELETLLCNCFHGTSPDQLTFLSDGLNDLRMHIALHGLPNDSTLLDPHESDSLRCKVWKILLGVPLHFDVEGYISKCETSSTTISERIRDDNFRTYKSNIEFWQRTDVATITRILTANSADCGYVQGMNVLLGPFLYVMPELESYYCFHALTTQMLSSYCDKNLSGVHHGIQLLDRCMYIFDKELHQHILSKIQGLQIFALRFIMTLMANAQPLTQVIALWDRILAIGVHSGVLVFAAHLMTFRSALLAEKRSVRIITVIEQAPIDVEAIMPIVFSILPKLPSDLLEELVAHTTLLATTTSTTSAANISLDRQFSV